MAAIETRSTLLSFDISEETGFIPQRPPLSSLPPYFREWEGLVDQLSEKLQRKELRQAVHRLPEVGFSSETLHSDEEWQRALVVLSMLFQGYMWQDGEAGLPSKMPALLSVPFHRVTEKIGVPLVGVYTASALYNWHMLDPDKPMELDNIHANVTYTGTEDESWFYMVAVQVELEAVPALKAIWNGVSAKKEGDTAALVGHLAVIESAITTIHRTLRRMSERCNPKVFFVDIRPYFAGTKGLNVFPDGMIYEGVDSKPRKYYGSSAGQSSAIRAIDVFIGVEHTGPHAEFIIAMEDYMPRKHRQFLRHVAEQPPLRQYVVESQNKDLIQQFNATVEAFVRYRSYHITVVTRYIVNQRAHSVNASLDMKGTGGTHFMKFLKSVRDNTKDMMIHL
ncbi:Indoleamine 2,3-dioxygenase 2 [Geodia barretti]|uniref:Indoleamine 2,3-dioxygenase 2 n=1 Tax=Geodia barretti TaxID=519541 RepID=A0AA35RIW5_GEOBA|nr:Indoleamine 2,3-dioxygenase 2 [Geodia barretti]